MTSSSIIVDYLHNLQDLFDEQKNLPKINNEIKIIEVINCPSAEIASELLSNAIFHSIIELFNNFTLINLKIDEKLNNEKFDMPKSHDFKIDRNFLISFESTVDKSQKIIYWKKRKSENLVEFKLFEGFSAELSTFVLDFFIDIVDLELTGKTLKNNK